MGLAGGGRRLAVVFAAAAVVGCARPAAATGLADAQAQAAQGTGAAAAAKCRFVNGFAEMHDLLGALVGDCAEDEWSDVASGDSRQRTTRGLLEWRRADGLIAFTDGARTWVRSPDGAIRVRANYERFPWEARASCGGTGR